MAYTGQVLNQNLGLGRQIFACTSCILEKFRGIFENSRADGWDYTAIVHCNQAQLAEEMFNVKQKSYQNGKIIYEHLSNF